MKKEELIKQLGVVLGIMIILGIFNILNGVTLAQKWILWEEPRYEPYSILGSSLILLIFGLVSMALVYVVERIIKK